MLRTRFFLIIAAAVMVVLLYFLPKSVVDNDKEELMAASQASNTANDPHAEEVSGDKLEKIEKLNEQIGVEDNIEKNLTFADSLAKLYISLNKYDSAAKFFELIAESVPTPENWMKTGDTYYEAYGFAMDAAKRKAMGDKARSYFEKVLDVGPNNLEVKNKLAMTLVSSSNPMQGILMLREILKEDPENEQATFNLGVLSMQSGQYDKAVERFENLIKLHPENTQAHFFLGISYLETDNRQKAKEQFLLVKSLDDDPSVQATVDSYLEDM